MTHQARLPYFKLAPKAFQAMYNLSNSIRKDLLGARLTELVFMRVSQINGCAYCMDMHWKDLVKLGMDPRHINAVAGWREAPYFTERECAALRWAEIVSNIPQRDPSDEEFAMLQQHFTDEEIAELGFAITTINGWNLLSVSFRNPVPAD
ncbi:carboxymuconolactone decarboxylase family protein [Massilia terrae]|uniref:Carboxymuconolactone decarboxylase family protein n=1 Tax=Massilia terrae TaxID=1811224 RepID=A0ABT2CXU5_9BURK|nr:carboxymuconolactone decarboxylase family protein [Massilia terrae]MCS0658801.1 carboxymuconolactone decarboxylase family protein [Massilia terrae]